MGSRQMTGSQATLVGEPHKISGQLISSALHILTKCGLTCNAYSLLKAFMVTGYTSLATITGDALYPPKVIPKMINELKRATIIVKVFSRASSNEIEFQIREVEPRSVPDHLFYS